MRPDRRVPPSQRWRAALLAFVAGAATEDDHRELEATGWGDASVAEARAELEEQERRWPAWALGRGDA